MPMNHHHAHLTSPPHLTTCLGSQPPQNPNCRKRRRDVPYTHSLTPSSNSHSIQ
ncbi:hypothetical protein BJX96DRAFT_157690 [Aspergillus floccosus]